jgi:aspartyl-tRNA(Asn)/glutamyl-tRNA(Gln) amidotransferase subunit A
VNLPDQSAAALSAAYAKGELSPVEVTQAVLARIDQCEPKLNAMYLTHRDSALAQARASEERWRKRAQRSALDGVPITIKENIYTQGDPAPIGTAAGDLTPKAFDAPPAARVREAGCVLIGKTTMPDYGMLSSGISSMHGVTRNPWQLDRNTSGSSSGAGAAAAAGYGPLHLGTDIGGSVRLPATHCGIFALKPSHGRVPVYPPFMARVTGPMTRTVRDAALVMNLLAQPDARDYMSLPHERVDYTAELESLNARGLRIGVFTDLRVGLPVEPQVVQASRAAAHALQAQGASVEEVAPFVTAEMLGGCEKFFEVRAYNDFAALPAQRQAKVLPFIARWCAHRAPSMSARELMQAYNQIQALREAAVAATAPFDFLISPTSPILAYAAESACPGDDPTNALPHIAFTLPWNASEQPAASINWSFAQNGLPIGVQVIGKRFDDVGVLRLGALLESLRPAQRPWPQL